MTTVYFIRHAQADNTNRDGRNRPLTEKGLLDRKLVTGFLMDKKIDAVISSPFKRAVDTVADFAEKRGLEMEIIEDFRERKSDSDWLRDTDFWPFIKRQWADFNYSLSDGECLRKVQERNVAALNDVLDRYRDKNIVIGTHGTALSTVINYIDPTYGFDDFMAMVDILPWVVVMSFNRDGCVGMEKLDLFNPGIKADYDTCTVRTYDAGVLKAYRFTVIFSRYKDKWLYCRAKTRDGFETPGGHIEPGETPLDGAKRELFEETGAVKYALSPAFDYTVHVNTAYSNGQVFIAHIEELGKLPDYEMAEVRLFDSIPDKMRFPQILPVLFERIREYGTKTGWERGNRTHFDEITADYDKIRWKYPAQIYTDIMDYSQTNGKNAVEIGAGTGIATAPFLDAGYDVTAVELGANMADFLRRRFCEQGNFRIMVSDFESVVLPENSYDLVYAASAFHWIDAEIGCSKTFRLLKSGGVFALFRNNAVPEDDSPLHDEIQKVYNNHYYSRYKPAPRPVRITDMTYKDFLAPAELHRGFRFESMEQYGFVDVTMKLYKASKTYSADDYLKLLETYSDHRALSDDSRTALYTGIRNAILRHGDKHTVNLIFQLYMGRKP